MAFADSFSSAPIAVGIPPGWTAYPGAVDGSWEVAEGDTPDVRIARKIFLGSNWHLNLEGIRPSSVATSNEFDVLARIRITEPHPDNGEGTALFANIGDVTGFSGMIAATFRSALGADESAVILRRWTGLSQASLVAWVPYSIVPGTWYWMRLRTSLVSSNIHAAVKIWTGNVLDEPAIWLIGPINTGIGNVFGYPAMGCAGGSAKFDCDYYAVASGGAIAPIPSATEVPGPIGILVPDIQEDDIISDTLALSWGPAPYAQTYRLQYLLNSAWVDIAQTVNPNYNWNTASIPWLRTKLRVRAENNLGESVWTTTNEFRIWQGGLGVADGFRVANRTALSVMAVIETHPGLERIHVEVTGVNSNFDIPVSEAYSSDKSPEVAWATVLTPNTKYKLRVRVKNIGEAWSDWLPEQIFRTLDLLITLGPLDAPNAFYVTDIVTGKKALHGHNPVIAHTYMDPRMHPEKYIEFGLDMEGLYGVNYKTRAVRLKSNPIHWRASAVRYPYAGYIMAGTIVLAFIPVSDESQELMGTGHNYMSLNAWNLTLNTFARPTVDSLTMDQMPIGKVRANRLNVAMMSWVQPEFPRHVQMDPCDAPKLVSDGLIMQGMLNGEYFRRYEIQRPGDTTNLTICGRSVIKIHFWSEAQVAYMDFGRGSPWSLNWWAGGPIGGNGNTFRGFMVEAIGYKRELNAGEMQDLCQIILAGGNVRESILATNPDMYMPFDEYTSPEKPMVQVRPVITIGE
jgi:hypothetical protein